VISTAMKGIPLLLLLLACSGSDDPAAPGRPQWLRDHEESIVQVPAHDFGQVVGGDLRFHTFLHPNDTDARWVVRDTWTGCGCVRVLAASETVDPGEALEVQVQFDPKRRRGPQEQPIFAVFDPGEQVVSFVVRAFVERASFAVPGVIIVPYGEPRARPFSIHTPDRVEPPIWIVRDGAGVVVDVGPAETVDDARGPLFVTSGELSLTEEFLQPGFSTVVRFSDVSTNSSGDVDIQVRVIAELQPALAPGRSRSCGCRRRSSRWPRRRPAWSSSMPTRRSPRERSP